MVPYQILAKDGEQYISNINVQTCLINSFEIVD